MSLSADDIAGLTACLAAHGLAELHLTGPGVELHLARPQTPALPPIVVAASGVGVFLTRHPLRAEVFAGEGSRVAAGQEVALLRIGLLLRPVVAPAAGILGAPLAAEGAAVGYGTQLFLLHPDPPESKP